VTQQIKPLAWALLYGATLGGNFTVVGSASNVVAVTMAAQRGYTISMVRFSKMAAPITFVHLVAVYIYCIVAFVIGGYGG
jgi:Na+/H+ antiporter NhaD/arsenite permease-like protein